MKEFYEELEGRRTYLESLEQTEEVKARISELTLTIIRVQQILLADIK